MNKPVEHGVSKAVDGIQDRLTDYACNLNYEDLSPPAIHAVKVRVIDTLGALIGGYFGEPCRIARNLAAQMPDPDGATIIGTRRKTTADMAAFVNGTTARTVEMNDTYHKPGVFAGHPSDVLAPVLAVAELTHASGREFITAVGLAYEVHLRMADAVGIPPGFDYTNYVAMGTAIAAGKLLGLTHDELAHCISMAVVPNNTLLQARTGHLTMFKAVAAGQAGRAGVFAALLARAGMEGPHLPFEGKSGWCDHVAGKRFLLSTMGGAGTPFKVQDTLIKPRPSCGPTQSSILAAEKVALNKNIKDVKQITVEVYDYAKEVCGTGDHQWHPESRETADHSIPYVVAMALMNGTVTPRHFDDAYVKNPEVHALMQKIAVVENKEFTAAYERTPVEHLTRVTVLTNGAQRLVGESNEDDLSKQGTDPQIEEKFRRLTEDVLSTRQTQNILDSLWHLEKMKNAAEIPAAFVFV